MGYIPQVFTYRTMILIIRYPIMAGFIMGYNWIRICTWLYDCAWGYIKVNMPILIHSRQPSSGCTGDIVGYLYTLSNLI